MKSEINDVMEFVGPYPVLKIHTDGDIVMFLDDDDGVVVKWGGRSTTKEGFYNEGWSQNGWKIFTGSVTLSND